MSFCSSAGSSPRLVLLPDDTDDRDPLQGCTNDEDEGEQPTSHPPPTPPLSPSVVFLYLVAPYLRLGAIYVSDIRGTPFTYCLAGLVVAASLSALCRQIWFLLGRYLRKSSTEDVLAYTFAHRRIRKRVARHTFTATSAALSMLVAAMYLRDSVYTALSLNVPELAPSLSRLNVSVVLCILVGVLSLTKSPASKSIVYATSLSVASYLAWLVAVFRSYNTSEHWLPSSDPLQRGILWNVISAFTFACATAMTVPLSASLRTATLARSTRSRSFGSLNVLSTILAMLLMFPLVFVAASSRAQASTASPNNLVLVLRIATLVFSMPSTVVSITSLPLYGSGHRFIHTDLALSIIIAAILALSLVPPTVASILNDAVLVLAVSGTFLLPALTHITIHYVRRPLSIVMPSSAPRISSLERPSSPSRDPLLQRKERLLQRSRFGKRLFWDAVVWVILIPICGCALVWMIGRLKRQW